MNASVCLCVFVVLLFVFVKCLFVCYVAYALYVCLSLVVRYARELLCFCVTVLFMCIFVCFASLCVFVCLYIFLCFHSRFVCVCLFCVL